MKSVKFGLMLLLILATSYSCIYEDLSDCPPPANLQLTFSYKGDTNDATMFAKMIDNVTLYCYRSSGEFVKTKTINKSSLTANQGTTLYLMPGDYKIISWANVSTGITEIVNTSSMALGRIHHPNYLLGTDIPTNDHLYYGELAVTIPATGITSGDIPHRGAHINVEVHVSGVGYETDPTSWAVVEMSNLMPQYTMQMADAQPYATTYLPAVAWSADHSTTAAKFCTLRFADTNNITVSIKKQGGKFLNSVNLTDFMTTNSVTVDGKNEATVAIMFKFYDGKFSISIPEWLQANVDPDI